MKLTLRKLNKMSDDDLNRLITKHGYGDITAATFHVNNKYVNHLSLAKTFDIPEIQLRYCYEVLSISTPHDMLNFLRVKHYEVSFGVCTLKQMYMRAGKRLTIEQIENLVLLGVCPTGIITHANVYASRYRKGDVPQAETPLFA